MRSKSNSRSIFHSKLCGYLIVMLTLFSSKVAQSTPSHSPLRRELSIAEALRLAEKVSPGIKAGSAREGHSKAGVSIAQSYFYPSLHFDAANSFGFPGSSIPTPSQFGGLMNSPFRVGPTLGVLGKLTLLDFGIWRGVDASRDILHSSEEETKIRRLQLDQNVLQTYFDGSRFRGQIEIWKNISTKTEAVLKTVKNYVKNGQYSEVQLLLIQDQTDEASMKMLSLRERYQHALKRLALLTDLNENEIACPAPFSIGKDPFSFIQSTSASPLLTHAEAELKVARVQLSQASSEHLPKVFALGSVGFMSDARVVNQDNYSLWVGVNLPIFEGFRISSEVQQFKAVVDEKENKILERKMELAELNASYDEQINVSQLELKLLEKQHQTALRTFDLTQERYLAFLEPVIHLKESIRNLARIETQMNDVQSNLLLAIGSKSFLNGSVVGN